MCVCACVCEQRKGKRGSEKGLASLGCPSSESPRRVEEMEIKE